MAHSFIFTQCFLSVDRNTKNEIVFIVATINQKCKLTLYLDDALMHAYPRMIVV